MRRTAAPIARWSPKNQKPVSQDDERLGRQPKADYPCESTTSAKSAGTDIEA